MTTKARETRSHKRPLSGRDFWRPAQLFACLSHRARDAAYRTAFGEADFVGVNQSGEVVVVEQKSGVLDESAGGLIKRYSDGQKNVVTKIHRTLEGIRDQFKRQSGHDISLDYLIYCPDYRLRDLNAVGLTASRIVDARDVALSRRRQVRQ